MNVGFCKKCQIIDQYTDGKQCSKCLGDLIDLGVTIDEWNSMTETEMNECIKKSNERKRNFILASGICPQCGGKIKVDRTLVFIFFSLNSC